MRGGDRAIVEAFEQAVAAIPHVRQAQRLFGQPGYFRRVITADLPAFPGGLGNRLATLPGVQRLSCTLVMKSVVENRPDASVPESAAPKGTGLRTVGEVRGVPPRDTSCTDAAGPVRRLGAALDH
jgi:Lrp/AsnC ligand binding domain